MKSDIIGLRAKVAANTGMEMRLYKVHEARRSPSDVSGRRISTNLRFFSRKRFIFVKSARKTHRNIYSEDIAFLLFDPKPQFWTN